MTNFFYGIFLKHVFFSKLFSKLGFIAEGAGKTLAELLELAKKDNLLVYKVKRVYQDAGLPRKWRPFFVPVRTKRAKRSTVYSYKKKYYIHRLWREFKPTVRNLSMKADSGCSFSFARVLKRYLVSVVLQCNQSKGSNKEASKDI